MKSVLILPLVLAGGFVLQAQSAPVTGTWTVASAVSGNQSEQTCTFTQKEAELSGTCKGERGSVDITGKVNGTAVRWQFDIDYEGQKLTPIYTGTLESADKIVGGVTVQGMGVDGEFTATRAR